MQRSMNEKQVTFQTPSFKVRALFVGKDHPQSGQARSRKLPTFTISLRRPQLEGGMSDNVATLKNVR